MLHLYEKTYVDAVHKRNEIGASNLMNIPDKSSLVNSRTNCAMYAAGSADDEYVAVILGLLNLERS